MRYILPAVALGFLAAPAAAAPAPQAERIQIPPALTDPEFIERIAGMTEALSRTLLDMPVGEVAAAAEGRPVTPADRGRTVRDLGRLTDPDFERNLQQQVAQARPQMQAAMQALARALPAMTDALSKASNEIERATANMPRPDYPRR